MRFVRRILILLAVLSLVGVLSVVAQTSPDDDSIGVDAIDNIYVTISGELEIVSTVNAMGLVEQVFMVGDVVIAPAGAFNPSTLEAGMLVEITGRLLNDDTIQASQLVLLPEPGDEPEVTPEPGDEPEVTPEPGDEPEVTPEPGDEPEVTPEPDDSARTCVPETHPVANTIADEFGVSVDTVIDMHCSGNGFGNIVRAFLLAENDGTGADGAQAILDDLKNGQGWGDIIRESGVNPSDLAPGRAINGRADDSDETAPGNSGNAPGNSGNAPGNSGNAPGNSGNAPGNSGNAPGNSGNAPGNSGNAPGNSGNAPGNSGNAPGNSGGNGNPGGGPPDNPGGGNPGGGNGNGGGGGRGNN